MDKVKPPFLTTNRNTIYIVLFLLCLPLVFVNMNNSHDWGDDFAQYIHQAINIVKHIPQSATGFIFEKDAPGVDMQARSIGFPLMLAPLVFFFGITIHPFSIYISVLLIVASFFLLKFFRTYFTDLTSILLVLIFIYNPFTLNFKMEIMSDIPFTLALILSIIEYQKTINGKLKHYFITSILVGCATLIRPIGMVILLAIIINEVKTLLFERSISNRFGVVIISAVSLFIYFFTNWLFHIPLDATGNYLKSISIGNIGHIIWNKLRYYVMMYRYYFMSGQGILPFLAIFTQYLVLTLTIIGFIKKCLKPGILEFLVVGYMVILFLYPDTNSGMRFIFPIVPLLLYYMAAALSIIKINRYKDKIILGLGLFILLPYSVSITNIIKNQNETLHGPQEKSSIEAFDYINKNCCSNSVIAFVKPRALALYTDKKTYGYFNPDARKIMETFKRVGVNYILLHSEMRNEHADDFIKNNPDKTQLIWSNDKFKLYSIKL
ncbi:MAG: hypothetical protein WCL14_01305 [Bacteroidota bacterium]